MNSSIRSETCNVFNLSWELISDETSNDPTLSSLRGAIEGSLLDNPPSPDLRQSDYWQYSDSLRVLDGVVLFCDRVVIPPKLRLAVLDILHSANKALLQ